MCKLLLFCLYRLGPTQTGLLSGFDSRWSILFRHTYVITKLPIRPAELLSELHTLRTAIEEMRVDIAALRIKDGEGDD